MILLLAHEGDGLAKALHAELRRDGHRASFIEASLLVSEVEWTWHAPALRGYLRAGDEVLSLEEISGALVRTLEPFTAEPAMDEADQHYVRAEVRAAIFALLEALPDPVVHRPSIPVVRGPFLFAPGAVAAVRSVGMSPAEALVGAGEEEARVFLANTSGLVGRLRSNESPLPLCTHPLADEPLARHPSYLVRIAPGGMLRLYAVGDRVVGAERSEDGASWMELEPVATVASRASALMRRLGLSFARLTFGRGPDWEECIDVQAFPVWKEISGAFRARLVTELAQWLVRERTS